MQGFQGKVVLITGASSGIGRATALRFARAGARLALAARTRTTLEQVANEIKALGSEALILPTDVSEPEQCRAAVEDTVNHFGRLDILLNSAGISLRANFADTRLEVFERIFRVNFFGTMHTTYFAIPHIKATRGSLVAISSLTGKRGVPSYAVYGASKFAIQGLYESLRVELASAGVHVGVVSPGFVDTPLREQVLGPDGEVWEKPPPPPFRVWPIEACVDCILDLIRRRRGEALLPEFVRALLVVDVVTAGRLGDRFLTRRFRADKPPG